MGGGGGTGSSGLASAYCKFRRGSSEVRDSRSLITIRASRCWSGGFISGDFRRVHIGDRIGVTRVPPLCIFVGIAEPHARQLIGVRVPATLVRHRRITRKAVVDALVGIGAFL